MTDAAKPRVSLVVPCYNEQDVLDDLRRELTALVDRLALRYECEILLVDDGSRDATWAKITAWAQADHRVRAVALSRNFGHQHALTCGYDLATGDAVISLDADLQDPPEVVPDLLARWEEGADVVYAVRESREGESRFKLWTARWFYRLFRGVGDRAAPPEAGDFRLMSRRGVRAFRRLREQHRYVRGMVGWLGFRTATVGYHRRARRAGQTKYPVMKMLAFAMDGLLSFSSFPLRLAYVFAALGAGTILAYLAWVLVDHVFFGQPLVQGWTSQILATTIFGVSILLCLGLMGEYLGRIYEQAKQRPLYLIRELIRDGHASDTAEPGDEG